MKIGENTGKVMLHNNIQCYSTGYFITETELTSNNIITIKRKVLKSLHYQK